MISFSAASTASTSRSAFEVLCGENHFEHNCFQAVRYYEERASARNISHSEPACTCRVKQHARLTIRTGVRRASLLLFGRRQSIIRYLWVSLLMSQIKMGEIRTSQSVVLREKEMLDGFM